MIFLVLTPLVFCLWFGASPLLTCYKIPFNPFLLYILLHSPFLQYHTYIRPPQHGTITLPKKKNSSSNETHRHRTPSNLSFLAKTFSSRTSAFPSPFGSAYSRVLAFERLTLCNLAADFLNPPVPLSWLFCEHILQGLFQALGRKPIIHETPPWHPRYLNSPRHRCLDLTNTPHPLPPSNNPISDDNSQAFFHKREQQQKKEIITLKVNAYDISCGSLFTLSPTPELPLFTSYPFQKIKTCWIVFLSLSHIHVL